MKGIRIIALLLFLGSGLLAANDSVFIHNYKALYDETKSYTDNDTLKVELILKSNSTGTVQIDTFQFKVKQNNSPYMSSSVYSGRTTLDFSNTYDTVIVSIVIEPAFPMQIGNNTLVIWPRNILDEQNQVFQSEMDTSVTKLIYVEPNNLKKPNLLKDVVFATSGTNLRISNIPNGVNAIGISNLLGQTIKTLRIEKSFVEISNLPKGLNFINFHHGNMVATRKVIVK